MLARLLFLLPLAAPAAAQYDPQPVLLVVMDDVGLDLQAVAQTPTLDAIAAAGVVQDRFVAAPTCSNMRAKLETGLYSIRPQNYVGGIFRHSTLGSLPVGPYLLAQSVPSAAQVGKWHLCRHDDLTHRFAAGFVAFDGSQANITGESYYDWQTTRDGQVLKVTQYATDYCLARAIEKVQAGYWYVEVSFNAVHIPVEAPPIGDATTRAMLEYMDSALALLVSEARARGYGIIVVADNGGTKADGGKGNLSHQALATFCVTLDIPGIVRRPVVDAVDLYATVVDIVTGQHPLNSDGISLRRGGRKVAFADKFSGVLRPPGSGWQEMATDGVLKVIRKPSTGEITVTDWFDAPSTKDPTHLLAALDSR